MQTHLGVRTKQTTAEKEQSRRRERERKRKCYRLMAGSKQSAKLDGVCLILLRILFDWLYRNIIYDGIKAPQFNLF